MWIKEKSEKCEMEDLYNSMLCIWLYDRYNNNSSNGVTIEGLRLIKKKMIFVDDDAAWLLTFDAILSNGIDERFEDLIPKEIFEEWAESKHTEIIREKKLEDILED